MALQKTLSLLLLSLLTLLGLGLGLVQPSNGETRYDKFQRQHVDSRGKGGNSSYCYDMMQTRGMMTGYTCKRFNTFIHEDISTIKKICKTPKIRCKNRKKNCHKGVVRVTDCSLTERSQGNCIYEGRRIKRRIVIACQDPQVILVTESSSLKILGPLLFLLFPLCGFHVHSQNLSWREFMKQHHLSTSWEFNEYRCNDLMREREAPKDRNYHLFIYAFWQKIGHICIRNWRDHYRNVYIWAQYPFKIIKCYWKNNKKGYKEHRSHSYIEFHCGMNGFVDSIEDIRLLEVVSN